MTAKNYMQSKRHDLSKYQTPELTWDFYDAFHRSKPTADAILNSGNSIEGENLDYYLKKATQTGKHDPKSLDAFLENSFKEKKSVYPHPFDVLMPLQLPDGRWEDLTKVMRVLRMPRSLRLKKTSAWESATAFAVATIRQRLDLYHILSNGHDEAAKWFSSNEFFLQAREYINKYQRYYDEKDYDTDDDEDFTKYRRAATTALGESDDLEFAQDEVATDVAEK